MIEIRKDGVMYVGNIDPGCCGSSGACLDCMLQGIKLPLGLGLFSAFFNVLVTCFRLPVFTGFIAFSQVPSGIAFNKVIAICIEQCKMIVQYLDHKGLKLRSPVGGNFIFGNVTLYCMTVLLE